MTNKFICPSCLSDNTEKLEGSSTVCYDCGVTFSVDCEFKPGDDDVYHPSHYNQGSIEVIDFIDAHKLGFYEGNIVKYVSRYKYKGGVQDLKKAKFYLDRLISLMEVATDCTE